MPFAVNFFRHTLLWALPDGEVASCTVAWINDTGSPLGIGSAVADAFASEALSFWTTIKPKYSPSVKFKGSRLALVGVDNKTIQTAERTIAEVPGTGNNTTLPTEVACVVSLRTAVYSRRTRGRIYLPPMSTVQCAISGRVLPATTTDIAIAASAYLSSFTVVAETFSSVVASATGSTLTEVNETRVGDVFDVQRRRRDAIAEVYAVSAVI